MNEEKKAAVLVVDMQNGVVANAFRRDAVLRNINLLVENARAARVPVIWIQHSDENLKEESENWQLVKELKPALSELHVRKRFGDSFEDTNLDLKLKQLGVRKLFVSGAQTDACIRATIHGAFVRGYDTVLVGDAHTTEDLASYGLPSPEVLINFTNIYWTWQAGLGRVASVLTTDKVQFSAEREILMNVMNAIYSAINRNDIEGVLEFLDDDIERVEPAGYATAGTHRGHQAVKAHFAEGRGTWAEGACEPENFIFAGDKIVACLKVRVRLKERTDWIEGRFADVFTFRGNKAIHMRTFWETEEALKWVGLKTDSGI